jgi:hypothetical protein
VTPEIYYNEKVKTGEGTVYLLPHLFFKYRTGEILYPVLTARAAIIAESFIFRNNKYVS